MALETRQIQVVEKGVTKNIPALNPHWCERRTFLTWIPPPQVASIDGEEWKEIMSYYNADLHWLLKLPHYKFWSQMIYDKSLQKSLVSFLQEAPRFYSEEIQTLKKGKDEWKLFQESFRLVFLVFLRLATHKETKENLISPETFGSLLYDHFMFDIPKLMDLCILFGPSNQVLLNKMIVNIFTHQPKYLYDLEEAANGLIQVFNLLLGQLGLDEKQATGWDNNSPLPTKELKDIVEYITDVAATIWHFIDVYPPAAEIFAKYSIQNKLGEFYEKSIPYLYQQLESIEERVKANVFEHLSVARKYLLQDFNVMLHSISIKPLLTDSSIDKLNCVEKWLEWLTCVMSERHFIVDYNILFPLQDDIDLMIQMSIPVDNTRVDYVRNGLTSIIKEFGLSPSEHELSPGSKESSIERVRDMAIDSLVAQVQELMPDLKDDFVQACLKHYDFNAESVINSILEGNLAPHLIEMQNGTETEPALFDASLVEKPQPQQELIPAISKFKDITKKSRTKTVHFDEMREMLDDKPNLKSVILERVVEQMESEYDDEYDDTYDGHDMGAEEPDATEMESRRSFVVPRVLRPKDERESEDEDEEEELELSEKPRDQFVANPAELREQAEQRRLSRRGRGRPGGAPRQPREVVGAPRGQGQDKETVIARRHKTENKSRGANHNRRWQADRKRREF